MKSRSPALKSSRLLALLLMLSLLLGAAPLTVLADSEGIDLASDAIAQSPPLSTEPQAEQRATQLPNGIYRMDNAGTHLSAVVNSSSLLTNSAPYLYTSGSALNQLWRITYHGSGFYTIRPYQNYNQLLAYDSSTGKICLSTSSTITSNMLWSIDTASYHTIRCAANNMALANDAHATTNSPLLLETYNSSSSASWQRWLLVEASSPASGIVWQASNSSSSYTSSTSTSTFLTIVAGKSVTYSIAYYSPTNTNQGFTWTSSSPSVASVSNGKITTVTPGTTTVTATHTSGQKLTINVTVLPLSNGTYFVMNAETEKYMQPYDNGESHMEQHDFSGEGIQKWKIEHYSSQTGYYTIRNESSGLYLTAPNNTTDGTSIVQQAYSSSTADRQLWKITQLSNGQYKIQAKARIGSNLYLAVGWGLNQNGINIEQRTGNDKNEWKLYKLNHTVSLDVVFDNAYSNRYLNEQTRINKQLLELQETYIKNFGIFVDYMEPVIFNSYADANCSTSYSHQCTHALDTSCTNSTLNPDGSTTLRNYHHNNIHNIMLRIPFPNTDISVKIAYIGHTNCASINGKHTSNPYYGLTYSDIGLITIMNFDGTTSETKTTVHEFGHLYKAPDHYGGDAPTTVQIKLMTGDIRFDSNCIYGENKDIANVMENLTICDGCKAIIQDNANKYS